MAESFFDAVGDSAAHVDQQLSGIAAGAAVGGAIGGPAGIAIGMAGLAAGMAGTAGGGRFSYEPGEMQALIKTWQDLADSYESDLTHAENLRTTRGPGGERVSESIATVVQQSGASLHAALANQAKYCEKQAEKFRAALNEYNGVETATRDTYQKINEGLA
jgi:hypothetical protein